MKGLPRAELIRGRMATECQDGKPKAGMSKCMGPLLHPGCKFAPATSAVLRMNTIKAHDGINFGNGYAVAV